jgi:MarR family transcriptional repressor of emrRAB
MWGFPSDAHAFDELKSSWADAGVPSASAAAALTTLQAHPGDGIDALSRVLVLTGSGTVRLVATLVDQGLVTKGPGVDGRSVALRLTDRGHRKARQILASQRERIERIVGDLDADERQSLVRLAEKILCRLTAGEADADRICRHCDERACPDRRCPVELALRR